ncbi:helix-turn-helix domain-containing protein [Nitrospina watsonii]|uniref:HTH luxR-type domain-containing protein n=1 Tax=Nitrospina watsonii TaxID=1323948 RepID=A0ABM9HF35_9BACT|nr:helix-turn-helix transcriptional regulator [Nitrospina watsonii]CAI2718914.1 HTH luxR-type domain-containing protein [Nitrospina watsonii]
MNDTTPPSLPEKDYLKIFDIIGKLHQCRVKQDLRLVMQNEIMPFFHVQIGGYAWTDLNLWKGMVKPAQAIDVIGLDPSQWPWANKLHTYLRSLLDISHNANRPVVAHDVDVPREVLQKELKRFVEDHPEFNPSDFVGFDTYKATMCAFDRENQIGSGFHRLAPNDAFWTPREVRLMELLWPGFSNTIKRVAIQDKLQTYKALITALEESATPLALLREDARVIFRNAEFQAVIPVDAGKFLPKTLRELVEQKITLQVPDRLSDSSIPPMTFYQHKDTAYRLNLTQLHPKEDNSESVWLLRLQTSNDSYTALHRKLQEASLTPREVEVAILAGDGLEDGDIAQRLFISPSTLKNHLKHIYQKLDVHSRTQLVARLRSSPEAAGG